MRFTFWHRRRVMTIEEALGRQMKDAMREGIHDPFQAGYAAALSWTWQQAGLPPTAESIALQAMVEAAVILEAA